MEGAAVDLLVEASRDNNRVIFAIECKRAYVRRKKWVFFKDPEKISKIYEFSVKELLSQYGSLFDPVCIEGVEIDEAKLGTEKERFKAASPDRIWEAAQQTCKGYLGLVQQELVERRKPQTTHSRETT